MTSARLFRATGLAAIIAGVLFVVIQPIHPDDTLASVTSSSWAIVHYATLLMTTLFLVGIVGIYAAQHQEAGWLGLVGVIVLTLGLLLTAMFVFVEATIEPLLVDTNPGLVEDLLAVVDGRGSEGDLGPLALLWSASGLFFLLGCITFGFAMFRVGLVSRWASALFGFGLPAAAIVTALLPYDVHRLGAMPIGVGLAGMGYSLWRGQGASDSDDFGQTRAPALPSAG